MPVDLPGAMSWTAIEEQARTVLAETRDSLAPRARIMVQADVLVWRGLRHVVRHEHRDLLVVGSAQDAHRGASSSGEAPTTLRSHRRASGRTPTGGSIGSASDLTAPSSHGQRLTLLYRWRPRPGRRSRRVGRSTVVWRADRGSGNSPPRPARACPQSSKSRWACRPTCSPSWVIVSTCSSSAPGAPVRVVGCNREPLDVRPYR